jgi:hypothetical protein
MCEIDFSKSLQDLDGDDWGEPTYDSTLVIDCHRLRLVPVEQLTDEQLCTLIGQRIGLIYLVPRVLEVLVADPLREEEYGYFPGDLLLQLLKLPASFWVEHGAWHQNLRALAVVARPRCDELAAQSETDWWVLPVEPGVVAALDSFLSEIS